MNESRPKEWDERTKRQIALVFFASVIACSIMIFFVVSSRTQQMIDEKREQLDEASGALPSVDE